MTGNAALYLRSSKDRHDVSIDAQRRELQHLAQSRQLTIVEEFADAVESGKDEDRPGFQALLRAIRAADRRWDTLLVLDTSRIARRRHIAIVFEEVECKRHGVRVVYKSLPESDPITEMLLKSILQAMDEWHSLTSRQKGLAGMRENVRQGFRAGGRAPTGYRLVQRPTGAMRDGAPVMKSVLEPDPERADAVARYLRDRAAGVPRLRAAKAAGLQDIADTTLIGIEWNALTYAGHTVWGVHAEREGGRHRGGSKRRPRSEWEIQRDTHPALITEAEAEQLLGRLEHKAAARKAGVADQRGRESDALLGGLLYAPDGSKWWAERDRYRWDRKEAGQRSIARAAIEEPVLEQVFADLASPEFADALVVGTRAALANAVDEQRLRRLRAELAALGTKIAKTLDLATGLDDPAPALRRVDELEAERRAKSAELQALEAEAEQARTIGAITPDVVRRLLADLIEEAKQDARSGLRASVVKLIERVELDPRTLAATLHYRIAAPESGVLLASPRGFEPRSPP